MNLARPGLRLELDLCEMFMSIPRDRVIPAVQHLYLKIIDIPRQNRGPLCFSISKDGYRKRDFVGSGSREFFFVITWADIMHFVFLSLTIDVFYVGASSIFRQLTGLPTGGSLSGQLASLFLIANEIGTPFPSRHLLPSLRYRDNYLFWVCAEWIIRVLGRTRAFLRVVPSKPKGVSVAAHLHSVLPFVRDSIATFIAIVCELLCNHIHGLLGIEVQFEQSGPEIGFLEAQLSVVATLGPISTKTPNLDPASKAPLTVDKWLDCFAPNTPGMLCSMVPNCVKKVQHLRLNHEAVYKGFVCLILCLALRYPTNSWRPPLVKCADKWGLRDLALRAIRDCKHHLACSGHSHEDFLRSLNSQRSLGAFRAPIPPEPPPTDMLV